jgi:hypothetical protein
MRNPTALPLVFSLAAASCARSIGTSGRNDRDVPVQAAKPKLASMITAAHGTSVGFNQPILGGMAMEAATSSRGTRPIQRHRL